MKEQNEILSRIKTLSPYFRDSKFLPNPYKGKDIKAILLGADPGTDDNIEHKFEFVFDLDTEKKSSKYFNQFESNLLQIGVTIDNLYIQNVIQNYFRVTTSKHVSDWKRCAKEWIPFLKVELDKIDPIKSFPILISANIVLEVLCLTRVSKPEYYYKNCIFIHKNENLLDRILVPFFRGGFNKYDLRKWNEYSSKIKLLIMQNKA